MAVDRPSVIGQVCRDDPLIPWFYVNVRSISVMEWNVMLAIDVSKMRKC